MSSGVQNPGQHDDVGSSPVRGWRGRRGSQRVEARHAWQNRGASDPDRRAAAKKFWFRLRILGMLLGFLGLLAWLLAVLLFSPTKTPLIFVGPFDYQWPLPPNAYVQEDLRGLQDLDDILEVRNSPDALLSDGNGLVRLQRQLEKLDAERPRQVPLVLYLRVYGATAKGGEACLLTPDASPHDCSSWLRVRDLLKLVRDSVQASRPKLLVLDCVPQRRNWALGVIENGFASGLQALLRELGDSSTPDISQDPAPAGPGIQVANLFVLTSSGPGEQAYASQLLGGSVFGHYFQHAVAGQADEDSDGGVSVEELHRYLLAKTDQWASENRDDRQRPLLIKPPAARDFRVTWVMRRQPSHSPPLNDSAPTKKRLAALWNSYRDIQEAREPNTPEAYAAVACREIEHKLYRAQQLLDSGAAYQVQAANLVRDLEQRFAGLASQQSVPNIGYWQGLDPNVDLQLPAISLHSLPLLRRMSLDRESPDAIQGVLNEIAANPQHARIAAYLAELDQRLSAGNLSQLVEAHLPRLLQGTWLPHMDKELGEIRAAMLLRTAMEELTVARDVRTVAWLREPCAQADAARRLFEDALFAEADAPPALQADVERLLDRASQRSAIVSRAYQLRDGVLADLPEYALWYTRPRPYAVLSEEQAKAISIALYELVQDVRRLGNALAVVSPGEGDFLEVQRLTTACEDNARKLREQFDADCEKLVYAANNSPASSDAASPASAAGPVAAPGNPAESQAAERQQRIFADMRAALGGRLPSQEQRDEMRRLVDGGRDQAELGPSVEPFTPAPEDASPWFGVWQRAPWRSHPALALIDATTESSPDFDSELSLDDQGGRLRDRLAAIHSHRFSLHFQADAGELGTRQALAAADQSWREAGALLPPPIENAVAELWRRDIQELMLWQGERALAEIAGPSTPGTRPLSEVVAADYLQFADDMGQVESPRRTRLLDELKVLQDFGRTGLAATVDQLLLPDAQSATNIRINSGAPFPSNKSVLLEVGQDRLGTAAVFVRDEDKVLEQGEGLALPLVSEQLRTLSVDARDGRLLTAVVFFRGYQFVSQYLPASLGGAVAEVRPVASDETTVTLFGRRKQRASIVVMLDCSQSMEQRIPGETEGDSGRSRLEIAKSTLLEILNELGRDGDARVGLFLFGHRRGWDREQPGVLRTQTNYQGEIPDDLQPAEDVEEVLELGRFNSDLADQVAKRLESVKPWGQTPLFLGLVKAIDAFDRDDPDSEKSIVIITDGRNYQFTPSVNPLGGFVAQTPQSAVIQRLDGRRIRINIVSLALQDATDVAAAEAELDDLAKKTRGRHVAVSSAGELIREVREAIGPGEYTLVDEQGRPAARASANARETDDAVSTVLDRSLWVTPSPRVPTEYRLQLDQIDEGLEVWPGAAVELGIAADGQSLRAIPFDKGQAAFARIGPQQSHTVRVHTPVLREGNVSLRVSLQDNTQLTTRPPEFLWLRISPLRGDGAPLEPVYTMYDAYYVPRLATPVVKLQLNNWPAEAQLAKIEVWFNERRSDPAEVIPLQDVLQRPEEFRKPRVVSFRSDVQLRIQAGYEGSADGAFRILVWETHPLGSANATPPLQVSLHTDEGVVPGEAMHRFDPRQGIAVHTYRFFGAAAERLVASRATAIELRESNVVLSNAWKLTQDQELTAPISGSLGTLNELVPPANR